MEDLVDAHWFNLASQGNIYSLTQLSSSNNTNKVLVASLKRKIYSCEYTAFPVNRVEPLVKELLFTYIPSGAEIISIDAYNKSEKEDEFVIGVTFVKPSNEGSMTSMDRYLNIYTEGAGEGDENNSLEAIAQNCLMVELNYTPYQLFHAIVPQSFGNEMVWLLSGSDNKIHMIQEDKQNHVYTEKPVEKFFPELDDLQAIALWMDVYYHDDYKQRITAIACECGLVKIAMVNITKLEIERSWSLQYVNPVCSIKIFADRNVFPKPSFLENQGNDRKVKQSLNIVVVTTNTTVVFRDVVNKGLDSDTTLTSNEFPDTILCSCVADVNMDGRNEILLGTYGQEVLLFAEKNENWELIGKKAFGSPIHSMRYLDLIGDGVKELIVLTQRGVHVLRHDPNVVMELWKSRFSQFNDEN